MHVISKRMVGLVLFPAFLSTGCSAFSQMGGMLAGKDKKSNTSIPKAEEQSIVKYMGEKANPTPKMMCDFAEMELNAKKFDKAEDLFRRALAADVKCEAAYVGLSKVCLAKNDTSGALSILNQAAQHCPNSAAIHNEVGVAKAKMTDFASAQKEMEKAVQIEPRNKLYVSNLAGVLASRGDFEKAFEAYSKVLSPAEANYKIAGLAQSQGKDEEGMRRLRLALIADPQYRPAMQAMERYYDRDVQPARYQPDDRDDREFYR